MQRAIQAVPTRGGAHYLLGTILIGQWRHDDAHAAFDTALHYGVDNPAQVLYIAGALEAMRQNWDAAASRFEQSVSVDAAFARGYLALAGTRAEQGRFDEARAAIRAATRLAPGAEELAAVRRHVTALESAAGDPR